MKKIIILFVFLLSGCSLGLFEGENSGTPFSLQKKGIVGFNENQIVTKESLQKLLGKDYQIRTGVHMRQGTINNVFDVLKEENLMASFYVEEDGKLAYIIFSGDEIVSINKKVHVGTLFSEIYEKAFDACLLNNVVGNKTEINCAYPENESINLIFAGEWNGPSELMPADDVLKNWKLERIIWFPVQLNKQM